MAARENEAQTVILDRLLLVLSGARIRDLLDDLGVFIHTGKAGVAAQAVDRFKPPDGHEPGNRVGRHPIARPLFGGRDECVVFGFLGTLKAAEEPHKGREDTSPIAAVDCLE
jgi:hypothetical protein